MPYYPITGTGQQYFKSSGGFALNYYLKFYIAGTNTAITCAANASATDDNSQPQTLDKVRINERGYPVNPSGGEIVPHIDQAYKLILYKSAADANANNTSAADWTIDDLSPGLVGFSLTQNDQDATEIDYIADVTATTRKINTRLKERISVLDFGADNTGAVEATTAFSAALLATLDVYIPSGTYLLSGISVIRSYQNIHFGANVILKAVANNNVVFKQTTKHCKHTGGFTTNSNGKSGVIGMIVGPSDLTDTTTLSYQIQNELPTIYGDSGLEETVKLQNGPTVGGSFSSCHGNVFPLIKSNGAVRAVFFDVPANANTVLTSHNIFRHVSTRGFATTNTGIHIASGSQNTFLNVQLDDVDSNGSPNSTATGFYIANTCSVSGQSNKYNTIVSGSFSDNSRDIDNRNATTTILGADFDYTNSSWTANPILPVTTTEPVKMYTGKFDSAGSAVHTPPTWSAPSKASTGVYIVNHNLGNTNYTVTATTESNNANVGITTIGNTSFRLEVKTHASTAFVDAACQYQVMAY